MFCRSFGFSGTLANDCFLLLFAAPLAFNLVVGFAGHIINRLKR